MKISIKTLELLEAGISPKTLYKLNETQINQLHTKIIREAVTQNVQKTTYSSGEAEGKSFQGTVTVNPDKSVTVTKESEIGEGKKKKKKQNPWAICHAQLGPKKTRKFERCVKSVKKSLAEGKEPLSLFFETEIMNIVEKNLPPRITKGDLITYLMEDSMDAPVREKPTRENPTREKPPKKTPKTPPINPGKNPNPKVTPAPKANSEDTKEDVIDLIMKILRKEK